MAVRGKGRNMRRIPGITRQEEEQTLKETITVAEKKMESVRENVARLKQELHSMQEEFDTADKEMQALWHTTDDMFKHVSQELGTAMQARRKPYFGRIDFTDKKSGEKEAYYIGRSVVAENPAEPMVIDWRAPIAGVYYGSSLGDMTYSVKGEGRYEIHLSRKRTYEIEDDRLKDFYDSDVVANDELLTRYLARNKRAVLGEIIATIQQEQNDVIRRKPQHNLIIQGAAGSGKTTVAMHRISYILYNYELEFAPEDFYIIGSNQVLLNYITGVLPELNVYGVRQMTMEQLFIRLLYEAWRDDYKAVPVCKDVTPPCKGTYAWFCDLENYCDLYEEEMIPRREVKLEKNGAVLLTEEAIERIWKQCKGLSRADKITKLTEHLLAKLENELTGKYYSYTNEEKKRLTRYYETYFGKREWKGDIFEMYEDFLTCQRAKGFSVESPDKEFDVYDLSALAYLYKRIQEDEVIREAGHVVIDEAQDFGMMAYAALKYCLSKCTYTIMGDISQNISMDYGLNDWQELQKLMLTDRFDYFGLLRKSYRNTIEISGFATDILYHGSFQIYPVEPIIRHGKEVEVCACRDDRGLIERTVRTLRAWKEQGLETIAVICADDREADYVREQLSGRIELVTVTEEQMAFREGVMVLTLKYTKGLEFDAVLIYNASTENYPAQDGYVKRLYVAATRALHELVVLYKGALTELIASPVREEQKRKAVVQVKAPAARKPVQKEEKTNEELYRERAREAEKERAGRDKYGPRRIVVVQNQQTPEKEERRIPPRTVRKESVTATYGYGQTKKRVRELPSYLERHQKDVEALSGRKEKVMTGEFGEMPDEKILHPAGHTRIDCSVRFVMKGKGYCDFLSSYGTLRITPVAQNVIRVCFGRGQVSNFPERAADFKTPAGQYRFRETPSCAEILTDKILVRVDKKTGVISFLDTKGKLLLKERDKEPRQVGEDRVWNYFAFGKGENLTARGEGDTRPLKIGMSAKYISFGEQSTTLPALSSTLGYELYFPARQRTLCCNIPMYGPYVAMEDTEMIDFYFKKI